MKSDDSVDAPPDALKWSRDIFKAKSLRTAHNVVEKIVAVLIQELSPGKTVAGERSASVGKVRQMLFEAGKNRVDLRVSPKEEGFDVRGQILGRGWEGAIVEFAGQKANLDKFGGFAIKGVGRGIFDLTIKGERIEIVLMGIGLE